MSADILQHFHLENRPLKIMFSRDGSRLLITSRSEILSCSVMEPSDEVRFEASFVSDAAFLNNERIAAVIQSSKESQKQKMLVIFDIRLQLMSSAITVGDVRSVSVDPHTQHIFAGRVEAGTAGGGYLDVYNFGLEQQNEFKTDILPFDMVISHAGNKLAVAGVFFEVWDVDSGLERTIKEYPLDDDCIGYPLTEVCAVDITPDGRWAAVGVYAGKADCFVVNCEIGNVVGWYSPSRSEKGSEGVRVAISPDGKYVTIAPPFGPTANVYEVMDGGFLKTYPINGSDDLMYSPHGEIRLLGSELCVALAFSPLDNILAIGGEKSVTLWTFDI